jgi:hypothetical protein
MTINVQWSSIKAFAMARNLSIQYVIANGSYYLAAIDGPMEMTCQIPMDGSDTTDQTDFETNFMPSGNSSPKGNVVQVLGTDNLTLQPFGAIFTATANTVTNCDIQLGTNYVLRGGVFFSQNSVMGDNLSVMIVDKDNVTGQGGTPTSPTVLGQYVTSWYVMPGVINEIEDISISEVLLQGLYLRVAYTSVSPSVSPVFTINLLSYVGASL